MKVKCPNCGQVHDYPKPSFGRESTFKCKGCGTLLFVEDYVEEKP